MYGQDEFRVRDIRDLTKWLTFEAASQANPHGPTAQATPPTITAHWTPPDGGDFTPDNAHAAVTEVGQLRSPWAPVRSAAEYQGNDRRSAAPPSAGGIVAQPNCRNIASGGCRRVERVPSHPAIVTAIAPPPMP